MDRQRAEVDLRLSVIPPLLGLACVVATSLGILWALGILGTALTSTLGLKTEQAASLQQILKGDPALVTDDSYIESVSPDELENSVPRLEQSHRRLAVALQPLLSGEQVGRLQAHFKDSEEQKRELIRYYRLFIAEYADSGK